ncbi:MAG: Rho termination factor N-terminal domain-containing protein [Sedimentisphaerales bacterium]|nr:Rho termination factor N-terminal domain-containing protein [Sedimentisphaerales bacterium]
MPMMETGSRTMTVSEIKIKAKALGINTGKMKKLELVHAIQEAEGFSPCYGRSNGSCPWTQCCWRGDCFKAKA